MFEVSIESVWTPEMGILLGAYDVWEVRYRKTDGNISGAEDGKLIGVVHFHHPYPIFYPENKEAGVDFVTMKAVMDKWERLGKEEKA